MRRAFSLIELLTVIAIIGVLIALLIPAVLKVRSMAANAHCANNLKQIGLAMQSYHDDFKQFPSKGIPSPGVEQVFGDADYFPSWPHDILRYIEQGAAYDQSLDAIKHPSAGAIWDKQVMGQVAATIVPTFLCPADPRPNGGFDPPPNPDPSNYADLAKTSYLGVIGKDEPSSLIYTGTNNYTSGSGYWSYTDTGVFPWPNSNESGGRPPYFHPYVKIARILDGTSNTVMIGERPPTNTWTYSSPPPSVDFSYGAWISDNRIQTRLWAITGPNPDGPDGTPCPALLYFSEGNLNNYCDTYHFWSFHSGGGNWLFCDGSVRFMTYSAGITLIPALATIAGDEVTPPLD
jgi:prepilin-type N-terminal cleavage/methylation domain-containing protein/prepilin-type processing-associated H-X9-DG protein